MKTSENINDRFNDGFDAGFKSAQKEINELKDETNRLKVLVGESLVEQEQDLLAKKQEQVRKLKEKLAYVCNYIDSDGQFKDKDKFVDEIFPDVSEKPQEKRDDCAEQTKPTKDELCRHCNKPRGEHHCSDIALWCPKLK